MTSTNTTTISKSKVHVLSVISFNCRDINSLLSREQHHLHFGHTLLRRQKSKFKLEFCRHRCSKCFHTPPRVQLV